MEVVAYGILTTVWWISSYTVLLPFVLLLKHSKTFQNKWFSWFFVKVVVPIMGERMRPHRVRCFEVLKEDLDKHGRPKDLKILEIGIGSGANLKFYPDNSSLVAVDMNPDFEKSFHETKKQFPQVRLERIVHAMAEDMNQVEDDSIDVVVSTFVLCSVQDVEKVLKEVHRVLKPGGRFVFLEHVAYKKHRRSSTVQDMVAPLWTLYFNGCVPNRDNETSIRNVGFSSVNCKNIEPPDFWFYIRPLIVGLAVK